MNKEDILQATDRGLSVFRHYLPVQFRIGKKFLNPLYKDTKASCNVYYDRRHSVYKIRVGRDNDGAELQEREGLR